MKNTGKRSNLVLNILKERCPNCSQGHVFKKGNLLKMPVMNEKCEACGYKFDREPGYFLGAMYVSYGIAVFFGILTYLACYFFFPSLQVIYIPIAILFVILAISRKNFKLSRVIYIHLFPW